MSFTDEEKVHLFNRARIRLRMLEEELKVSFSTDGGPIQVYAKQENIGCLYGGGVGCLAEHLEHLSHE